MRLADLRTTIKNLDEAKAAFDRYAKITIDVQAADAKMEARIAALKEQHAGNTLDQIKEAAEIEDALVNWIDQNRDQFEKPKTIPTNMGSFGLRKVSDVLITDEAVLIEALKERHLEDCFKAKESPVKPAIKARLKLGETIPGCVLREGETATCTIAKALLDEAKKV